MRRGEGLAQGSGQQVEINGNDQSAGSYANAHLGGKIDEAGSTGDDQQKPVGTRNEIQDTLLGFHAVAFFRPKTFSIS